MCCRPPFPLFALLLLAASGCAGSRPAQPVAIIEPAFISRATPDEQLDSLALWRGSDGERWLIATGKQSHRLRIMDARDGSDIGFAGGPGSAAGQFNRPNGIFVIDDLLLVAERDNARVQVFAMPGLQSLGSFGESLLTSPYGLWVMPVEGAYRVFVTDSYQDPGIVVPDEARLDRRVREFRLALAADGIEVRLVNTFGPTEAPGALRIVESIWGDEANGHLLVAEEDLSRRGSEVGLKVFGLGGRFLDRVVGVDAFRGQPEGIALWQCEDGSGYWLASDQSNEAQRFLAFDRQDFGFIGAFGSTEVWNSDGIWLHQDAIAGFPQGVLYVMHDDMAIAAFDWAAIAAALGLAERCR